MSAHGFTHAEGRGPGLRPPRVASGPHGSGLDFWTGFLQLFGPYAQISRCSDLHPVLVLSLTSSFVFTACDKLLPGAGKKEAPQKKQEPQTPRVEKLTQEQMELRFRTARSQFLNGKVKEAMEGFTALATRKDVGQPVASWIDLYQGLVFLLSGKLEDAKATYGRLAEVEWEVHDPSEKKMLDFFHKAGRVLSADGPAAPEAMKEFNRSTHESIAILSCGIKNWALGKMEEAEPFLRNYSASYIQGSETWIGSEMETKKLQTLASNIEESQMAFGIAMKDLEAAKSAEDKKDAVEKAKLALPKLRFAPKLKEQIETLIAKIEPEATAAIEKMKGEMEAAEKFDAQAWPEALEKYGKFVADLKFEQAKDAILKPDLKTEKYKTQQESFGKRAQWLATFKEVLAEDLKTKGYKDPVKKKDGTSLTGGVVKADDEQVTFKAQPPVSVSWGDLDPANLVAIAQSFIPEDMAPFLAAHRRWQLGVFMVQTGQKAQAKPLLKKAAEANPVYTQEIEPLLEEEDQ